MKTLRTGWLGFASPHELAADSMARKPDWESHRPNDQSRSIKTAQLSISKSVVNEVSSDNKTKQNTRLLAIRFPLCSLGLINFVQIDTDFGTENELNFCTLVFRQLSLLTMNFVKLSQIPQRRHTPPTVFSVQTKLLMRGSSGCSTRIISLFVWHMLVIQQAFTCACVATRNTCLHLYTNRCAHTHLDGGDESEAKKEKNKKIFWYRAIFPCVALSSYDCSLLQIIVDYCQIQKRPTIWIWVQLLWAFGHFAFQRCIFVPIIV